MGPTILLVYPFLLLFKSYISVTYGLQSVAVGLFFSFLVTYSARLIFQFCVADLIATRSFQPSLYHCWTKDILSKRKGIYFLKGYFLFPLGGDGEKKKKKKKKKKKLLLLILVLILLSTSSPLSFNLGIC